MPASQGLPDLVRQTHLQKFVVRGTMGKGWIQGSSEAGEAQCLLQGQADSVRCLPTEEVGVKGRKGGGNQHG